MDIKLSKIKVVLPQTTRVLFQIQKMVIPFQSKILIQGASGKGKTTLLHLIAGLFLPDEGHVEWGNTRLTSLNDESRAKFRKENSALVFQKLNLIDHLTAKENILLAINNEEKALAALKAVDLEDKKDTLSTYMSLGEQQRVAVSRALAQKPKVILADEPTSSLDEKNANHVMDALFEAAKDSTLIIVSHDYRISKRFDKVLKFEELVQL